MKSALRRSLLVISLSMALAATAQTVGQPAPPLQARDTRGQTVNLADFKGKTVVLEWVNPGCPFVKKHYGSGNMQGTQKVAVAEGVVWLSISSTHPGSHDYKPAADLAAWAQQQGAHPSAVLMDDDGTVGRAWGAKTTPHLYIVNGAGTLVYAGAIDSKPSPNPADVAGATNYVKQALVEMKKGQPLSQPSSKPYGCSIKYG